MICKKAYIGSYFILFLVAICSGSESFSQSNGDYRSRQTGNWHTASTWEVFNAGSFRNLEDAASGPFQNVIPSQVSGAVEIQNTHVVTTGSTLTIDQLTVGNGAQWLISSGIQVTLNNGSGIDLLLNPTSSIQVSGTLIRSDLTTISGSSASNLSFLANSTYRHLYRTSEGVVPLANWALTSTLEISGFVSSIVATNAGNWSQSFGHVIYSCSQSPNTIVAFEGLLNSIQGDLTVSNTGANTNNRVELASSQNGTITIGGSFTISGAARCYLGLSASNLVLNIGSDFIISASSSLPAAYFTLTGQTTINVNRDFSYSGSGQIFLSNSSTTVHLNVKRNFTVSSGTLTTKSGSNSNINLNGSGLQTFQNTGSITSSINLTVAVTSVVDFGTSLFTGTGSFTNHGRIRLGSIDPLGAYQSGSAGGNIRSTGTRTFAIGSIIELNGLATQFVGANHPTNAGLTINNSIGVELNSNLTLTQPLELQSGNFNLSSFTLTVSGNYSRNTGSFETNSSSSLLIQGTGTFGSLEFSPSPAELNNFTVNRAGLTISLNTDLTVVGTFSLLSTSTLNFSDDILTISGPFSSSSSARLAGNTNADLILDGMGAIGVFRFLPSGNNNRIRNWTINRAGTVTLGNGLNLFGTLSIQSAGTTFVTSNALILRSTDDQPGADASIATIPAGSSISGTVTVERYISAIDNRDRFISSPISNAPVSQLQDDFSITGTFTGTSFPCTGCLNNGASLTIYDEPTPGVLGKGYKDMPTAGGTNSQQLIPGRGYDAYMWNGVTDFVWDVSGNINTGTINFTLSHTPSSPTQPTADGWNLLGNPYPSAIQWNNGAGWSRTNIDPTVWVWDVKASLWRSFNANNSSGNLANGIIALGQGFWVYVPTPAPASMSINEQAKSTVGPGSYYREKSDAETNLLTISLGHNDIVDNAYLLLNTQQDSNSPKLSLGIESMSLAISNGHRQWAYYYHTDSEEVIELQVKSEMEGVFYLSFDRQGDTQILDDFYLLDRLEGTYHAILDDLSYRFTHSARDATNRFALVKSPEKVNTALNDGIKVFPNPVKDYLTVEVVDLSIREISVVDAIGKTCNIPMQNKEGVYTLNFSDLNNGVYFIRVNSGIHGTCLKRVIKL
jgi:hypothetical protein